MTEREGEAPSGKQRQTNKNSPWLQNKTLKCLYPASLHWEASVTSLWVHGALGPNMQHSEDQ